MFAALCLRVHNLKPAPRHTVCRRYDRSVAAVCGTGGGGGGAGAALAVVTVEIACLKINCSWLFDSRMTEYLSNPLIFPINFTPLMRKTVTGSFSRRTVLR